MSLALFATACTTSQTEAAKATPIATTVVAASTPAAFKPPAVSATATLAPDAVIRLVVVPEQSEARYRVHEQLVGVSLPDDAVGVTKAITGTIVGKPDGTIVSAQSKFRVDLRTLKSNEDRRDNFLRRNVLETDRYPYAEFVPLEAPGLPLTPPTAGDAEFKLVGDLTIRNVPKRVTWDARCKAQGDEGTCQAKTTFTFAQFNLTQPRVPVVLSVEDNIRLEIDIYVRRQ